jgi:16S rRNA (cytosine1407-C5)-methyltransferase
VRECARKQKSLLRSAFRALKPGGTLVYCTCSFAPEENERIVASLLKREESARLLPVVLPADMSGRVQAGLAGWDKHSFHCEEALRVLPDQLWDGFFLARIEKQIQTN